MGLRDPSHRKKSWSQTERLRAEAYFDDEHALHVHKDKVRFYLNLDPVDSASVAGPLTAADLENRGRCSSREFAG